MQTLSTNSIRRRVKRRILNRRHDFFAICAPGFELVLRSEIATLPEVSDVTQTTGGVSFSGPIDIVYLANLQLNTAHRLLLRIKEFSAHTFPMLYDQLSRVEWELWIPHNATYRFRVRSKASKLSMRQRILETCQAATDARMSSLGLNAQYDLDSSLTFTLRLHQNRAMLSLDTSGDHLHKRGYKPYTVAAPVRETLAASVLLYSRYQDHDLIVDPFCGSGTFLIEGARMASGRPAGHARSFGFTYTPFFSEGKLARLQQQGHEMSESQPRFVGFDVSEKAVETVAMNLRQAQLEDMVTVQRMNFLDVDFSAIGHTARRKLIITNPPYGKRINFVGLGEVPLAELLVERLSGWSVAVLAPSNLAKADGLSSVASQTIGSGQVLGFSNGGIRTYLHYFQVK